MKALSGLFLSETFKQRIHLARKNHVETGVICCPYRNEDFCSRSRHAKKITAGICLIFRGLFFEHNTEIEQKDHLWMNTIYNLQYDT